MSVATPIETLTFTRTIQAPVDQVYKSFTDRDWIQDWFCDEAKLETREGSPFLLTWQSGYYAFGTFKKLEPNKQAVLAWRGAGETSDSTIEVNVAAQDGATLLTIYYRDFHPEAAEVIGHEWETRLDNLKKVLEDGSDLRITNRVIIGIFPDTGFNAEMAQKLGVPVTEGVRIGGLVEGRSAALAGLQVDDVIVEIGGEKLTADRPIFSITGKYKANDVVDVVFYRGSEQHTVKLKLLGYPVPPQPADYKALGDTVEKMNAELLQEFDALFAGCTEEEASRKPAPGEWNAKEVLAHLILNERWVQSWLGSLMQTPEISGYSANTPARIAAITTTFPTLEAVLNELRRSFAETVALLRNVPDEYLEHKSMLWWATFEVHGMPAHTRTHIGQIRAALEAARS